MSIRKGNIFEKKSKKLQKGLAKGEAACYNIGVSGKKAGKAQGYSSAGRVLVSKTKGRGFESFCPCQKKAHICLPRQCVLFSTKFAFGE